MSQGHVTWRGLALLAGVVAPVVGGAALFAGNFGRSYIREQLDKENITMPTGPALADLPLEDQEALKKYEGQKMSTGPQAKAFAEHYIARHLDASCEHLVSADGSKTFDPIPEAMRNHNGIGGILRSGKLTDPDEIQAYAALRQDFFMGDMLRGTLLNVYGWSILASLGYYAGIGLCAASPVLLGAAAALKSKD